MKRIIQTLVLASAMAAICGCSTQPSSAGGNSLVLSEGLSDHETIITIDAIDYRVKAYGSGDVTVIFESGIALPIETWSSIEERTVPQYVAELRNILRQQQIHPPYMLVAHSMGGYIARYFAWKYPADVVGILLIDPAPEALYDSFSTAELSRYLEKGNNYYSKRSRGSRLEWESFYRNRTYMYDVEIDESIPVMLLSASGGEMSAYQRRIVEHHANSEFIEVDGSHFFHNEHPERIVDYIRRLWELSTYSE